MSVATEPTPSIGSLIQAAVEGSHGEFQAGDIADSVLDAIDPSDYRTYLRYLIVSRVSSETGKMRDRVSPARGSLSTKQSLIRDSYWPAFLNQMIALPTGYKRLADASPDDLMFLANMRRSQAKDLMAKAEQFEALAHLMNSSGVGRLGDLDSTKAERLLAA